MEKHRLCVIGAGNISNSRHIPAIKKRRNCEIVGVISNNSEKLKATASRYGIANSFLIEPEAEVQSQLASCGWFVDKVDAVVIGTPPKTHSDLAKACLTLGKHTLVEKPMAMDVGQCDDLIRTAEERKLVLNVMHTFQYANGIRKLDERLRSGEFGAVRSIVELQFTNRDRRLPAWYNDLPLGLFFDEAAHFFYMGRRFGGPLAVKNASAQLNAGENTPRFLQAQLMAGDIPLQMTMNFDAPICEWAFMLLCEKKIAIYDFFKDILIVANNDGMHLAKNVLLTSVQYSYGFWKGFIANGVRMFAGDLLYGHDVSVAKFVASIESGVIDDKLSPILGREVVAAMNAVATMALNDNGFASSKELL